MIGFAFLARAIEMDREIKKAKKAKAAEEKANRLVARCYHKCRTFLNLSFWVGVTISFPLEHLLWAKIIPELFPALHPYIEYLLHAGH